ncbi:unnamed protein product [Lampetra fluviatilis]
MALQRSLVPCVSFTTLLHLAGGSGGASSREPWEAADENAPDSGMRAAPLTATTQSLVARGGGVSATPSVIFIITAKRQKTARRLNGPSCVSRSSVKHGALGHAATEEAHEPRDARGKTARPRAPSLPKRLIVEP